jgi:hypothetical protein
VAFARCASMEDRAIEVVWKLEIGDERVKGRCGEVASTLVDPIRSRTGLAQQSFTSSPHLIRSHLDTLFSVFQPCSDAMVYPMPS